MLLHLLQCLLAKIGIGCADVATPDFELSWEGTCSNGQRVTPKHFSAPQTEVCARCISLWAELRQREEAEWGTSTDGSRLRTKQSVRKSPTGDAYLAEVRDINYLITVWISESDGHRYLISRWLSIVVGSYFGQVCHFS